MQKLITFVKSRKLISYVVLFALVVFGGIRAYASHIFGGELLYTHVSGNQYRLTLTLYGDCSSSLATGTSSLFVSYPLIYIYDSGALYDTLRLKQEEIGEEVSPVCAGQINKTTCNGGTLPGVRRFVYADTVTLGAPSADWRFIFSGDLLVASAGRSSNISNTGTSTMQIEAALNNLAGPNSSPEYANVPTPFYCMRPDQQYNQAAVDADGDSLVFSLVPAKNGYPTNPLLSADVSYVFPFTGASPIATASGGFSFSSINGQMTFTPSSVQDALVVTRVSEYRSGQLVGTSQREMTFIVADNCEGTPPTLKVGGLVGGAQSASNIINVCHGTHELSFHISIVNPDLDTTDIHAQNVPPGANITISNDHTPSPYISFSWATDTLPQGVYTFYLDVRNNHCPISSRQTLAYTINITDLPGGGAVQAAPTNCIHQGYVNYTMSGGFLPRTVNIMQGSTTVHTYIDTTGAVADSLPAGNYTMVISSGTDCATTYDFSVVDSGTLPLSPVVRELCEGEQAKQIELASHSQAAVFTWFDAESNILPAAPTPSTWVAATYTWFVQESYKVCVSDKVPVEAIVHPLPDIKIAEAPAEICYGDTLYLDATGGSEYSWSPAEEVNTATNGRFYAYMVRPGKFTVQAQNDYGCTNKASLSIDKIEQCCRFSYPSAFTPNGDGLNDRFRVVTYGNSWSYRLAIYNRWGQLLFLTFDPKHAWDGTYNGQPCEIGTYFYQFSGRCLTGGQEEHQGDVTLIR